MPLNHVRVATPGALMEGGGIPLSGDFFVHSWHRKLYAGGYSTHMSDANEI